MTGVDETTRHDGASANCSLPDVVVLSEYVPSELAVHFPVTWRDPVTGTDAQPKPNNDRSSAPDTLRHDDVALHVPTKLPPQAATLEQDAPPAPLLLPLEPELLPEPELLEPELSPELDAEPEPASPADPPGEVLSERDPHATNATAGTRRSGL